MRRMRDHIWLFLSIGLPLIGVLYYFSPQVAGWFKAPEKRTGVAEKAQEIHQAKSGEEGENFHAGRKIASEAPRADDAQCAFIEYNGDGPVATRVRKAEWSLIMSQFHGAKSEVVAWLHENSRGLSPVLLSELETKVKSLRIQRPPVMDEPDVSWRGIGVYSYDSQGLPIVKVGGGLVKLALQHPVRSKFEVTRLVAQALNPCEMAKHGHDIWSGLTSCLGMPTKTDCAAGAASEGGWAVSSLLANDVAAPGCAVSAFQDSSVWKCWKGFHFSGSGRSTASVSAAESAAGEVEHE